MGRDERALQRVHSHLCLPQPFSKSAIEHVQGHLVKRQVPPDLFQVCAELIPHCLPTQPGSWSAPSGTVTNLCHPPSLPQPYIEEICQNLRGDVFQKFIER